MDVSHFHSIIDLKLLEVIKLKSLILGKGKVRPRMWSPTDGNLVLTMTC